jgi:hypothetical protein
MAVSEPESKAEKNKQIAISAIIRLVLNMYY